MGLGGTTVTELSHFVSSGLFDVVLTAFNYNALYREAADDLLPGQRRRNGGPHRFGLWQGGLGRRFDELVKARPLWLSRPRQRQLLPSTRFLMTRECRSPKCPAVCAFQPDISCALIGAKSSSQLEASLKRE